MTLTPQTTDEKDSGTPTPVELAPGESPPVRRRQVPFSGYVTLLPAAVLVLIALIGPWIIPFSATEAVGPPDLTPGTDGHWFGTDSAGMDVFSRTIAAKLKRRTVHIWPGIIRTLYCVGEEEGSPC